jgi:hypothetical protein
MQMHKTQCVISHLFRRLAALVGGICIDRFFGATTISAFSVVTRDSHSVSKDKSHKGEKFSISWKLSQITLLSNENDMAKRASLNSLFSLRALFRLSTETLSTIHTQHRLACLQAFMIGAFTFSSENTARKSISQDNSKALSLVVGVCFN